MVVVSEHAPPELDGDLADAIAENPEAVARFVERLDAVNELIDVLALGEAAMDDEMAASLAGTASTLAESADGLATEETVALATAAGRNGDDLAAALETVAEMQASGTLEDLADLAQVASLATAAMDDEMVTSLADTGSSVAELADAASDEGTRDGVSTLLGAVGDAETADPEPVGVLGLARATRDPEVKAGLGYLLALASALGNRSSAPGSTGAGSKRDA